MKNLEHLFEGALWNSRFVVLFAVIASLATAFVMFFVATVDAWFLVGHMVDYMSADLVGDARATFRSSTVTHVVEIVDVHADSEDMPDPTLHAAGFSRIDFYNALWTLTETCFNLQRTDNFAMASRAHRVGMAHIGETQPLLSERLSRFSKAVEAGAWSHAPDAMKGVPELFELAAAEADSVMAV